MNTKAKQVDNHVSDNLITLPQLKDPHSDILEPLSNKHELTDLDIDDNVQRLVRSDGKANSIKAEVMTSIYEELYIAAEKLAEEHGLVCARVIKSFDDSAADVNLKFSVVDMVGIDIFARNLIEKAEQYGFKPSDYGKKFVANKVEYMITGLDDFETGKIHIRLLQASSNGNKVMLALHNTVQRALASQA